MQRNKENNVKRNETRICFGISGIVYQADDVQYLRLLMHFGTKTKLKTEKQINIHSGSGRESERRRKKYKKKSLKQFILGNGIYAVETLLQTFAILHCLSCWRVKRLHNRSELNQQD